MNTFTEAGVLAVIISVLWKVLGYLFDMFLKKNDSSVSNLNKKLDMMLQMQTEQNLKLEKLNMNHNHSYTMLREVKEKESELRGKVSNMEIELTRLMEWKKITEKQ